MQGTRFFSAVFLPLLFLFFLSTSPLAAQQGRGLAAEEGGDDDATTLTDDLRSRDRGNAGSAAIEGVDRHYLPITTIGTYLVFLPPGYEESEASYPLCVILHGNGSSEINHGRLAERLLREDVIYVVPRAPYPHFGAFQQGGAGWTWSPQDAERADLADLEPTRLYVDSVFASVEDARRRYRVRGDKIALLGHSMGAWFAHITALLHPQWVTSYFAYAGGLDGSLATDERLAALREAGVEVYLAHGRRDTVVGPVQSQRAKKILDKAGVKVKLRMFEAQHQISDEVAAFARDWLRREVLPEK